MNTILQPFSHFSSHLEALDRVPCLILIIYTRMEVF